ncbi:MAG: hypothetical protein R3C05_14155 [Pirellulaceae bacterium]
MKERADGAYRFRGIERLIGDAACRVLIVLIAVVCLVANFEYALRTIGYEGVDATLRWFDGVLRFSPACLAALLMSALVMVLQVVDLGDRRFAETLRNSTTSLLLILHCLVVYLAATLCSNEIRLFVLSTATLMMGITCGLLMRGATRKGVLFAKSIEKSDWSNNLLTMSALGLTTAVVIAIVGVWYPLISHTPSQLAVVWSSAALLLGFACTFGVNACWYRSGSLADFAAVIGLGGAMTAGIAMVDSRANLLVALPQVFGIACFLVVLVQRVCDQTGCIRWLTNWRPDWLLAEFDQTQEEQEGRGVAASLAICHWSACDDRFGHSSLPLVCGRYFTNAFDRLGGCVPK